MDVFPGNSVWDYMCIECGRAVVLQEWFSNLCGRKKVFLFRYTQLYFQYKKTGEKTSPNFRIWSKGQ